MLTLLILEDCPEKKTYEKCIINPDDKIECITNKRNRYYPEYNCCVRMTSGDEFYVVDILDNDSNSKSLEAIKQFMIIK